MTIIDPKTYDEALIEKSWEEFNMLYKNQGYLLSSVRSWQKLDATSIVMKPKKIKIPKKGAVTLTSIWFDVDFEDKANMSFNGVDRELRRIIIEAVLAGKLTPYKIDELEDKMTIDEFKENLTLPSSED